MQLNQVTDMPTPTATPAARRAFDKLVEEYCRKVDTSVGRPLAAINSDMIALVNSAFDFRTPEMLGR